NYILQLVGQISYFMVKKNQSRVDRTDLSQDGSQDGGRYHGFHHTPTRINSEKNGWYALFFSNITVFFLRYDGLEIGLVMFQIAPDHLRPIHFILSGEMCGLSLFGMMGNDILQLPADL